ncbi:MAG: type II toxin-antitoxin system PemK/MazF family toxin [Coriobacteriia bacterium]|nr:type II toxin-antitoxin system PemK/MazF family toxin [Coriobacteriia bacterium]
MTSSSHVQAFDIWLVYLHFSDRPKTGKVRPVLVVNSTENRIAVAKITSKPPVPHTGDVPIVQWQQAGLNVPSTVRCSQIFEINAAELLRDAPIGTLQTDDAVQIIQAMTMLGYF